MMVQNPSQSSYVPHTILDYTEKMTFVERFVNVIFYMGNEIVAKISLSDQEKLYRKYFPNSESFPPVTKKFYSEASIVFVNSHFSIDYSLALQPNLVKFIDSSQIYNNNI
jgi:glucuronosyltransferase